MGNSFLLFGAVLLVIGFLMNVFSKFGFPTLPGDIIFQKENFTFYFPVVTSIVISIILTVIFNLFH